MLNYEALLQEVNQWNVSSSEEAVNALYKRYEEHPIEFYTPTSKLLPFHQSDKRIRFIIASNRSGKTTTGASEMVWWLTGTHPYLATPPPPIRAWIVSLDHQEQREGSQRRLLEKLPRSMIRRAPIIQRDIIDFIELTNGSIVTFKSLDSQTEKFAAAELQCVWIDEEPPEEKYKEIYMRLIGGHQRLGSLWVTMTPVKGITWSFYSYFVPFLEGKNDTFDIFQAEIWDNPHIPVDEAVLEMNRLYTPDELEARLHGRYTILAGKSVFPLTDVKELAQKVQSPEVGDIRVNKYGNVDFEKDTEGCLEVFEPKLDGQEYVIGADVSEGLGETDTKKDYSVAVVIKRHPLKVVAMWRSNMVGEDIFAYRLDALGRYYNDALIGVEDNSYGKIVNFILASGNDYQDSYPNLYQRETYDEGVREITPKIGWRTTGESKPRLISAIFTALRDQIINIPSATILNELSTYIRDKDGKASAQAGSYDDCIIGLGIALVIGEGMGMGGTQVYNTSEYDRPLSPLSKKDSPKDHFARRFKQTKKSEHWMLK